MKKSYDWVTTDHFNTMCDWEERLKRTNHKLLGEINDGLDQKRVTQCLVQYNSLLTDIVNYVTMLDTEISRDIHDSEAASAAELEWEIRNYGHKMDKDNVW